MYLKLDQTKRTAQPRLDVYRTLVFRLPVEHSNHSACLKARTPCTTHSEKRTEKFSLTSWLRAVRASDGQSEDPGSIPGRTALFFFFRLNQLSVHIFVREGEERLWFHGKVSTETNFWFEQVYLNAESFRWCLRVCRLEHPGHLVVKKNWRLRERRNLWHRSCRGFVRHWLERPTGNRKT